MGAGRCNRRMTLVLGVGLFVALPSLAAAQSVEVGVALNGTNLTYYPRATATLCQADCAGNPRCRGSTWIRAGTYKPSDAAMCYLLSAVTSKNQARGHISLVKPGGETRPRGPVTNPNDLDPSDFSNL